MSGAPISPRDGLIVATGSRDRGLASGLVVVGVAASADALGSPSRLGTMGGGLFPEQRGRGSPAPGRRLGPTCAPRRPPGAIRGARE
jgi:hypothetical protein